MAGTAEGIAKARAAREAKRKKRDALDAVVREHNSATELLADSVAGPVAPVGTVAPDLSTQGQALAEVMIDQLQPAAVRELAHVLRNGKSEASRLAAASKLLDLGVNKKRDKASGSGAGDEPLAARLAEAIKLRTRAELAVDARVISEEPVAPAAAPLSGQPDSQSE